MYSVIIVDDEMLVRMGLKAMVNWEELGFEIVGEAANGQVAYEKFLVEKPDLVITDIKMPKKDGLWLTEKIKADYPDTEIIILTCHDEFDYARKAIKLQVSDYILKAEMEEEDVSSILLKKKEILDKRRRKTEMSGGTKDSKDPKDPHGDRLLGMLLDVKYPIADVYALLDELKVNCQGKKNCFAIFDFSGDLTVEKYAQEKAANIVMVCMELIENEFMERFERFFLKRLGKSVVVFLLDEWLSEPKMQQSIGRIRESISRYFSIHTKVAMTAPAERVGESRGHVEWLYGAVNDLFFSSSNEILTMKPDSGKRQAEQPPDKETFLKIVAYLLAENPDQASTEARNYLEKMKKAQQNAFDFKLSVTHLIANIAYELLAYLGTMDEANECMRQIMQRDDFAQVAVLTEEFLGYAKSRIIEAKVGNYDLLIRKAQAYIEEHYQEKITLDDVAGRVGVSRYYLSTLFKHTAGINFSAYLNEIRIKRAIELLKDPAMTVSQVFGRVGFHDPQYFSKTFKKYTGMTVKEYRLDKNGALW